MCVYCIYNRYMYIIFSFVNWFRSAIRCNVADYDPHRLGCIMFPLFPGSLVFCHFCSNFQKIYKKWIGKARWHSSYKEQFYFIITKFWFIFAKKKQFRRCNKSKFIFKQKNLNEIIIPVRRKVDLKNWTNVTPFSVI